MTKTKQLRTNVEGVIPTIHVVGFHGRLGPDQTPARRGPVYADDKGRAVALVESSPIGQGGFTVTAEVFSQKTSEEVWKTTGTRTHPWPAVLGNVVVILGEREAVRVSELIAQASGGAPKPVLGLLRWLTTSTDRSDELHCCRIEDLVAWYCTRQDADALFSVIASVARRDVITHAREADLAKLRSASFWLSRAAIEDSDVYFAVAGLRQTGFLHWQELLEAGVRNGTPSKRLAAVEEAARQLSFGDRAASLSPTTHSESRFTAARQAIKASFLDLKAPDRRRIARSAA